MTNPTDQALLDWIGKDLLDMKSITYPDMPWNVFVVQWHIYDTLQSWRGIGLVVEAMEKRGWRFYFGQSTLIDKPRYLCDFAGNGKTVQARHDHPWLAVFLAARKAVEG